MSSERDVLVVEDEGVVCAAVGRILAPEGLSVDAANDAEEALAKLADTAYRLVLTDLMLPGASGFEILGWMKTQQPRVPVVVITGYATLENALLAFNRGAFDFIPKPFDVGELLGVIRRALRFAERPRNAEPESTSADSPMRAAGPAAPRYFLGQHAWATLDEDGSAVFGVAETFPRLVADSHHLDLPSIDDHTTQGRCFARFLAADEIVYRIWAPLSGVVIAINSRVRESIRLIDRDPFGEGWLVRIIPENLEKELEPLIQR